MLSRNALRVLKDILCHRRPHLGRDEVRVIRKYIDTLPGVKMDSFGNRVVSIGKDPVICWSCHTDTVHNADGTQRLRDHGGVISLKKSKSNCLGADDGAGMMVLREMVLANVPGLYIFHRGEERGGLGSSYISEQAPQMLDGIKAVVAFDRRGTRDIITHQAYGRTASDEFAESLAAKLKMGHEPSEHGSFTDSANYADQVGECTNVAVGYDAEHGKTESLDYDYLFALIEQLVKVGPTLADDLTYKRQPGEDDPYVPRWVLNAGVYSPSVGGGVGRIASPKPLGNMGHRDPVLFEWEDPDALEEHYDSLPERVVDEFNTALSEYRTELGRLIREHPNAVERMLLDYGIGEEEVREAINDYGDNEPPAGEWRNRYGA